MIELVNVLTQADGQTAVTSIADKSENSCGSAYSIIREDLRYHKICARWVTEQLTDEHKQAQDQEIKKCAFCQQSDVDTVLGLQWAHP
jgi:hypothetical protein